MRIGRFFFQKNVYPPDVKFSDNVEMSAKFIYCKAIGVVGDIDLNTKDGKYLHDIIVYFYNNSDDNMAEVELSQKKLEKLINVFNNEILKESLRLCLSGYKIFYKSEPKAYE